MTRPPRSASRHGVIESYIVRTRECYARNECSCADCEWIGADRAEKVTPVPGAYRRWEVNVSDHRPISSSFDMQVSWENRSSEFRTDMYHAYEQVKSILSAQRAQVWSEIEAAWFGVESHLLDDARSYYSGM